MALLSDTQELISHSSPFSLKQLHMLSLFPLWHQSFVLDYIYRTPQSLIAGLMWIGIKDGQYFLRHMCQDSDGLSTYGWTDHNGRDYGRQVIVDQGLSLTTSFLKEKGHGSGYGGDWAVRINMQNEK